MKRLLLIGTVLLTLAGLVAVVAAARQSQVPSAVQHQLEIRFEPVGCHSWSLDGGAFKADQTLSLRAGQSVVVVNHDVCTHTLSEKSGRPIAIENLSPTASSQHVHVIGFQDYLPPAATSGSAERGLMTSVGGRTEATFYQPGTYVLVTHEGDTTLPGAWSTVGPDNQLVLHVHVYAGKHMPE